MPNRQLLCPRIFNQFLVGEIPQKVFLGAIFPEFLHVQHFRSLYIHIFLKDSFSFLECLVDGASLFLGVEFVFEKSDANVIFFPYHLSY